MNNWLMIKTQGDPLGTLRKLVKKIWKNARLDGMLVPIDGQIISGIMPAIIYDPARIDEINPFKPLMSSNAAKYIPELINKKPDFHFGALLRPCEMRALVEMSKRSKFSIDNLVTISVDCLGTLPADEFTWRASRKGSSQELTYEQLQFARQGGIMAYRYRSACQLCVSPNAYGADLNIGIMGLPVRQTILLTAKNSTLQEKYQLDKISDGPADVSLVKQREKLLARLDARRTGTRERVTQGIADIIPDTIEDLINHLEECRECKACLDICPICSVDYPQRGEDNKYLVEDIMRWMLSCAGCGMCEQVCPKHQPLNLIFGNIQKLLAEEYLYTPGASTDQPLPVFV